MKKLGPGTCVAGPPTRGYESLLLSDCTAATDYGNYMATLKTMQQAGGRETSKL